MILLDDVVEVFDLAHHHRNLFVLDDLVDGCFIGATLVQCDLFENTAGLHGLVKKSQGCGLVTPCGQQEINRFTRLVYGTIKVLSLAIDFDIGFVCTPAAAHSMLVFTKRFFLAAAGSEPHSG